MQEEKKGTEKIIQGSKKGKLLSIVISPPALKVHCGHQNMNQGVLRTTTKKARFLEGEERNKGRMLVCHL